ncbi:MAG: tyrosine-type recombinase/integrase [Planctomycetes bacterium]|nr:tyrosine-type recombinase/integrase [Planctomycetota bacterium]
MSDSTRNRTSQKLRKPPKVPKEFPLWPHPSGRWCKKIKQKFHYFGRWDTPGFGRVEAKARWDREKEYLKAGKTPPQPEADDRLTLKELFDRFLEDCEERIKVHPEDEGITRGTFNDYKRVCQRMSDILGKDAIVEDLTHDDFGQIRKTIAKTRGPVAIGSFITRARVPFAWALKNDIIERQVRYGSKFNKPSSKDLLKNRNKQAEKFFEADELRALIDGASQPLKSMILLAANAAYGNSDVGNLPKKAIDLEAGIVEFPRPKTGEYRRCLLWPETVASLREWYAMRPKAKQRKDEGLAFLTKYGASWATETNDNPVSKEFAKLAKRLKLNKRFRGFYSIRHTFRTVADDAVDTTAVAVVMGHKLPGMASVYVRRNRVSDDRLRAVVAVVHDWLFSENAT